MCACVRACVRTCVQWRIYVLWTLKLWGPHLNKQQKTIGQHSTILSTSTQLTHDSVTKIALF